MSDQTTETVVIVMPVEAYEKDFSEAERQTIYNALCLRPDASPKWYENSVKAVKILTDGVEPEALEIHLPVYKLFNTKKTGVWGFGSWNETVSIKNLAALLSEANHYMELCIGLHTKHDVNKPVEGVTPSVDEKKPSRFAKYLPAKPEVSETSKETPSE